MGIEARKAGEAKVDRWLSTPFGPFVRVIRGAPAGVSAVDCAVRCVCGDGEPAPDQLTSTHAGPTVMELRTGRSAWHHVRIAIRRGEPVSVLVVEPRGSAHARYADTLEGVRGVCRSGSDWFAETEGELARLAAECEAGRCPAPQYHCDAKRILEALNLASQTGRWSLRRADLVSPAAIAEAARAAISAYLIGGRYMPLTRPSFVGPFEVAEISVSRHGSSGPEWHRMSPSDLIAMIGRLRDQVAMSGAPVEIVEAVEAASSEWSADLAAAAKAANVFATRVDLYRRHQFVPACGSRPHGLTADEVSRLHRILAAHRLDLNRLRSALCLGDSLDAAQVPAWMWSAEQIASASPAELSANLCWAVTGLLRDPYQLWVELDALRVAARLAPRGTESRRAVAKAYREWRRLAKATSAAFWAIRADGDRAALKASATKALIKAGFSRDAARSAVARMSVSPPPNSPLAVMRELADAFVF